MSDLLSGYANAAAQIGLQAVLIRPLRGFSFRNAAVTERSDLFIPQVAIEEDHHDTMTITSHPVEFGSSISDHAFKQPAELTLKYGWSNSPEPSAFSSIAGVIGSVAGGAVGTVVGISQSNVSGFGIGVDSNGVQQVQINQIYQLLLQLQAGAALFAIYTGKRFYTNMIIQDLSVETDSRLENVLMATIRCKQIIIANANVVSLSPNVVASPQETASDKNLGTVQAITR